MVPPTATVEKLLKWKWYRFVKATGIHDCNYCSHRITDGETWTNDNRHITPMQRRETDLWIHEDCARLLGVLW